MASETKSFGQVWGELLGELSKVSLLPPEKAEKKKEKIVLSAANDLIQSVKNISDGEIEIVSTAIRVFFQGSGKESATEMNGTIQKWLYKKASSKETKEFVSENMD